MIIAVDFDGTLHGGRWPEIGNPLPYAREIMTALRDDGHYLIINTARDNSQLIMAVNWLLEKNIPFDRVNDNHPEQIKLYGNNSRKVYAHLYIDDKQVGGLPPWPEIYDYVLSKEAEYFRTRAEKKK